MGLSKNVAGELKSAAAVLDCEMRSVRGVGAWNGMVDNSLLLGIRIGM